MAYIKPRLFASKVFNKIAMMTGMSNSQVLAVTRRSTSETQRIPVIPVEIGGSRYIVSTHGESQWVRNVRANPTVTLHNKSGQSSYRASEVPVADRDPIIAAYREKAGASSDGYWDKLPDPADHPVFRLA